MPASTWDALLSHLHDPADAAAALADIAQDRLLYRYSIPLYRRAADAGDETAAWMLAELLADPNQTENAMRARAEAGDGEAARLLAGLLAQRSQIEEASDRGGSA